MTPTTLQKNALENLFETRNDPADYSAGFFERMIELMRNLDSAAIGRQIEIFEKAQEENRTIFLLGNGGSSAVCGHIVNDLCPNSLVAGKRGFRAYSLADNVESVTAIANDSGYENIFSYQLQHNMVPGDVVVGLSVSGNSENIIRAIDYANANGGLTVGWSGIAGGKLAERAQVSLHIPSTRDEYGPVEDIFSNLGHVITGYLTMKRGRKLAH